MLISFHIAMGLPRNRDELISNLRVNSWKKCKENMHRSISPTSCSHMAAIDSAARRLRRTGKGGLQLPQIF